MQKRFSRSARLCFSLVLALIIGLLLTTSAAQAQSWKFMVVGDTRGTSSSDQINTTIVNELARETLAQRVAFVLVPGDLVNSGDFAAFQNWKTLMAPVYNAGIGVYPVIGNHDTADVPGFIQVFGPDLPDNGPAGEVNRTYAFSYGNALILGLDTYVNVGRVNQGWINSVLSANTLPHVFAFGHMPAFKAAHTDCLDDYPTERDAFWTSLRNAGSKAYFCGHDHFYDHMRVDDRDGDENNDVHQLIVGGGGAPLTGGYTYDGANTIWTPVGMYHDMQYGYTVVEVNGPSVTMTYYHRTGANTYVATSEAWSYTVNSGPMPPSAPTGVTATAGDGRVVLNWQASAGATSYDVQRAVGSPTGTYSTIASALTTTTYTDTTAANGMTYYYTVIAVNAVGSSDPSAYIGATPRAPSPPSAPASLAAVAKKGQVKLSWPASAGATSYNVKRATTDGGPYSDIKNGITSLSYTDTRLKAGTYYYVVTAVNADGESTYSPQATAQVR